MPGYLCSSHAGHRPTATWLSSWSRAGIPAAPRRVRRWMTFCSFVWYVDLGGRREEEENLGLLTSKVAREVVSPVARATRSNRQERCTWRRPSECEGRYDWSFSPRSVASLPLVSGDCSSNIHYRLCSDSFLSSTSRLATEVTEVYEAPH